MQRKGPIMRHLKWGLLAAGGIAHKFANGLATTDEATALAVGSRDLGKAKKFAEEHGIERAYGSYEELLADGDVDAVYISTPNSLHAEWSIAAAKAGKHILCEKPVTTNAPELEKVLAVVKEQGVFFMEAFMYRCHPQWKKLREVLDSGRIGQVRILESSFSFNMGQNYLQNIMAMDQNALNQFTTGLNAAIAKANGGANQASIMAGAQPPQQSGVPFGQIASSFISTIDRG